MSSGFVALIICSVFVVLMTFVQATYSIFRATAFLRCRYAAFALRDRFLINMKLTKIYVSNFKSLAAFEVALSDFTCLIGLSGKIHFSAICRVSLALNASGFG